MELYVVQQGDSIYSISEKYGIAVEKLAIDNGLAYPYNLAVGQVIVIARANTYYTVQQGDTLEGIASAHNVTVNQILRNNPYLVEREYIYPGEVLVISYDTVKSIATIGFAYPFIKRETLIKTLPNLTYLSIFNYTTTEGGEIKAYQDDTEIIALAREYRTVPILMISTLTLQGMVDYETAYRILLNAKYQEENIENFIDIMKAKGYYGVNVVFNFLNADNQILYLEFVQRISKRLSEEGFLFLVTININVGSNEDITTFLQIDYSKFSTYVNDFIFINLRFGAEYGPPSAVTDIDDLQALVNYLLDTMSSDKVIVGIPLIGYDWQLPYVPQRSSAVSLTVPACYELAYEAGSVIQFDEESQTPYFYYTKITSLYPFEHIVWFVDARSVDALNKLIVEFNLAGSGIWNIMNYSAQLWTLINANFDIIKLL